MDDLAPGDRRREVEYHEGSSGVTLEEEARGPSMTRGLVGSTVLAFLIGWIPLLGPAVAGFVGGWLTRSRLRGIYATQIAAIVCLGWGWAWTYLPELPFVGPARADRLVPFGTAFSATVVTLIVLQYNVCVLFGWIGGWAEESRDGRADSQWPRPV